MAGDRARRGLQVMNEDENPLLVYALLSIIVGFFLLALRQLTISQNAYEAELQAAMKKKAEKKD